MMKAEFRGGPCGGHFHYIDDGSGDEIVGPCAEFDEDEEADATYARTGSWRDQSSPVVTDGPIYGWKRPPA